MRVVLLVQTLSRTDRTRSILRLRTGLGLIRGSTSLSRYLSLSAASN